MALAGRATMQGPTSFQCHSEQAQRSVNTMLNELLRSFRQGCSRAPKGRCGGAGL